MRTIKFRVWREDYSEMADLLSFNCIDEVLSGTIDENVKVMQFTGLYDKNGGDLRRGYR